MDAGAIYLMGGVAIKCQHAFTQTGGTFTVGDDVTETLTSPWDFFEGGKIVFNAANGFGTLALSSVTFDGVEIDMRIGGGTNSGSDQIISTGTVNIRGNSKLVVTALNPVVKGSKLAWTLITPGMGKKINNDFGAGNAQLPPNAQENVGALPNSWQCMPIPS